MIPHLSSDGNKPPYAIAQLLRMMQQKVFLPWQDELPGDRSEVDDGIPLLHDVVDFRHRIIDRWHDKQSLGGYSSNRESRNNAGVAATRENQYQTDGVRQCQWNSELSLQRAKSQ